MMMKLIACLLFAVSLVFGASSILEETAGTASKSEECSFAVELFFLQDISHSYDDDMPHIRSSIPLFFDYLVEEHVGSRIALASFSDYPFVDVGFRAYEPRDYCFKLETEFTTDVQILEAALNDLYVISGRDYSEASLVALHHAAKANYFSDTSETPIGDPYVRVIIISTDATPHTAGDLAVALSKHPEYWDDEEMRLLFGDTDTLPEFVVKPNDGDAVMECGQDPETLIFEDYVSLDQAGEALAAANTFTIFLATEDVVPDWQTIALYLWSVHGVHSFVVPLREDSSDLLARLTDAIVRVQETFCEWTTEAPPTSTPPPPTLTTETQPGICSENVILDFVLLQDVTSSYQNDLPNLRAIMPPLVDLLENNFIDPRYGLAVFGDKPLEPMGSPPTDFCYRLLLPLGRSPDAFDLALNSLRIQSGRDWEECQLEGLANAALQGTIGWRGNSEVVLKVVALSTDAGYHEAGDGQTLAGIMTPYAGGLTSDRITDYPTVEETIEAIKAEGIMPLFLVTQDVIPVYIELKRMFNDQGVPCVIQPVSNDSQDIMDAIERGLGQLCDEAAPWLARRLSQELLISE